MDNVIKVDNWDLCEICKKRQATLLCDMPKTIVTTIDRKGPGRVEEITLTCDKKICEKCATEVNPGIHFCKECVDKWV